MLMSISIQLPIVINEFRWHPFIIEPSDTKDAPYIGIRKMYLKDNFPLWEYYLVNNKIFKIYLDGLNSEQAVKEATKLAKKLNLDS